MKLAEHSPYQCPIPDDIIAANGVGDGHWLHGFLSAASRVKQYKKDYDYIYTALIIQTKSNGHHFTTSPGVRLLQDSYMLMRCDTHYRPIQHVGPFQIADAFPILPLSVLTKQFHFNCYCPLNGQPISSIRHFVKQFGGDIPMAETDLKLLGRWSSPYVMRVKIALNIKSLQYEFFQEDMNPKSDLLLQSNPVYGTVPVLIHNGNPICESLIIVEYIDETWSSAPSILPSDPYDRAISRFWASYIDDKWFPSMRSIIIAEEEEERKPYYEQMEEVVARMEDAFGKCSKGRAFFGGDRIGFLDIAFGCFMGWLSVIENVYGRKVLVEAKAPALVKWAERFAADPAVKGLIPETDKLIELSNSLRVKWRADIAKN